MIEEVLIELRDQKDYLDRQLERVDGVLARCYREGDRQSETYYVFTGQKQGLEQAWYSLFNRINELRANEELRADIAKLNKDVSNG